MARWSPPVSFAAVNAEFNWWLLIVGLVVGAGLVWLVLLDSRRREDDVSAAERATEAEWLSEVLAEEGVVLSPALAERVLYLHAEYLATSSPPDDPGLEAAVTPADAEVGSVPGPGAEDGPAPRPAAHGGPATRPAAATAPSSATASPAPAAGSTAPAAEVDPGA
jgi:hypothetical protein